jgi:hypothetical protein
VEFLIAFRLINVFYIFILYFIIYKFYYCFFMKRFFLFAAVSALTTAQAGNKKWSSCGYTADKNAKNDTDKGEMAFYVCTRQDEQGSIKPHRFYAVETYRLRVDLANAPKDKCEASSVRNSQILAMGSDCQTVQLSGRSGSLNLMGQKYTGGPARAFTLDELVKELSLMPEIEVKDNKVIQGLDRFKKVDYEGKVSDFNGVNSHGPKIF